MIGLQSYTIPYTRFYVFSVLKSSFLDINNPGTLWPYITVVLKSCTINKTVLSLPPSLAASDRRSKEGKAVSNSPHGAVTTHVSQSADSDL